MLTLTYDGESVRRYTDGKMEKSTAAAYTTGLSGPTAITIGRDGPDATYAIKEASLSEYLALVLMIKSSSVPYVK